MKEDLIKCVSDNRTSIMGISMISVMLFHQNCISIFPFNFFHVFGYWGVDIFLFLSGIGLVRSYESNSLILFYKHRIIRIIPSCLMCGTLKYVSYKFFLSHIPIMKDGFYVSWLTTICFDLWFIPTIIILYSITPLLYHVLKINTFFSVSCILIIFFFNGLVLSPKVGFNWFSPVGILVWTIARLPVFTAGIFLGNKKNWGRRNKVHFNSLYLIIAILLKLMIIFGFLGEWWHTCVLFFLALGLPTLLLIIIFLLERLPRTINKGIKFFGHYSLELYLVHEFIFKTLKTTMNNNFPFIILLVSFCISILTAYLCKIGVERLKCAFL